MKRRRLAALSEHMETRLVLSPLLSLSGRVTANSLRTGSDATLSAAETNTLSTAEGDSNLRNAANTQTVETNRDAAQVETAQVNERLFVADAVEGPTTTEPITHTVADSSDSAVPEVVSPSENGRAATDGQATTQQVLASQVPADDQPRLTKNEVVETVPSESPETKTVVDQRPSQTLDNTKSEGTTVKTLPANDVTRVIITNDPVEANGVKTVGNEKPDVQKTDSDTSASREENTDSSVSVQATETSRVDVQSVLETDIAAIVSVREVETARAEVDSAVIENRMSTDRTGSNLDRTSADVASREVVENNTAVENAKAVVDEIDPVTQVVPVFDEATGTVRLGVVEEAPALNRRVVAESEAIDQESQQRGNADSGVTVDTDRQPKIEEIAADREEVAVETTTVVTRDEADNADRSTTPLGTNDVARETEEQPDEETALVQPVLRSVVGQPLPLVRAKATAAVETVEETAERVIDVENRESTVAVPDSDADSTPAVDVQATEDTNLAREMHNESSTENSDDAEAQETDSEPSATEESTAPSGIAPVVTKRDNGVANDVERIIRLSDEELNRPVKDRERTPISRTEMKFSHQTGRMTTAHFDVSATAVEYTMRQHDAAETAASQTVFGDATRLGIMLAAIKTAGRRSGSQVLFSLTDDDARGDSGSGPTDRRRRERTKARRWESFRQKRGLGELPFDDIDESAAIPCSNCSVDSVFADSASMCVLFHEPGGENDRLDASLPLAGLLLGGAGVAAHHATKRRGKKPATRPELPVPQYSGDTIVFAD